MSPSHPLVPSGSAALLAAVDALRSNPVGRRLLDDPRRLVGVLTPDGILVEVNAAGEGVLPVPSHEVVGQPAWQIPGITGDQTLWRARLAEAADSADAVEYENVAELASGSVSIRTELSCVRDAEGGVLGFLVLGMDVDEARRAQARVGEQERLREVVFDQAFQLITILSPDGVIRDVNRTGTRLGIPRDAAVGRRLVDVVLDHPTGGAERAALWQARLDEVITRREPIQALDVHEHPETGVALALECFLAPVHDPDGSIEAILLEIRDRSEQYGFEQRLRESEERFRAMAEAVPHMTWSTRSGPQGVTHAYFSPRWTEFTGLSVEHLLEHGITERIHPDDREHASAPQTQPDGTAAPMVFRVQRHDGEYRWVEARMSWVDDPSGGRAWFGASLDITDRIEQEHEDRRLQEQLRATLEFTGFGTYVWLVPEDRFSRDSQLEPILGIPMEGMMTGNAFEQFFALIHAEDRAEAQASVLGSLVPGGPDYDAEFRIIRPADGGSEERWVSAMGRTEFDERGEPLRLVGVFVDTTDKRLEDDARLRLQKLEAIGTLASGIAHDFNNVIGAILSYARVAEAELKAGVSPATSIGEIARGAHRAGDIVKRLLTFSREDESRRVPFDLAAVAEEARALAQPSMPAGVQIAVRADAGLPEVMGDPTQLHQVILNLLTNAGQAIGDRGGAIEVVVARATIGRRGVGIERGLEPGEYLCLAVGDDGPGMHESVARRIFDPFFTTKVARDGTGLGLTAAQSIVQRHGGSIAVETSPGNGAKFTLHLPAAGARDVAAVAPEPIGPPPATGEDVRILFVDDEQALVRLAYRAMPYHGCVVSGFTDPREAAEAFEKAPDIFDAMITDYSMPGLTGLDLTERIKAVRPDLPVVLTSGYMGGESHAEAMRRGVGAIVPKPCSIDTLADEVFRLLGRERAPDAD